MEALKGGAMTSEIAADDAVPAGLDFLGIVRLTRVDMKQAAAMIAARPASAPFTTVIAVNSQLVVVLDKPGNPLRGPCDAAWMRLCDGQILRLLGRLVHGVWLPLAAGSDLTLHLLRSVIRPDDAITVIGGDDAVAAALRAQYGLRALAQHQPPMGYIRDPAAVQACVDFVLAHPARFVFVATGAPQSEQVLLRIQQTGQATGLGMAVGSSLLFATGLVPRAPTWMRRWGLEWLFRLAINPRRHARRVFVDSLPVFWLALRALLRRGTQRE